MGCPEWSAAPAPAQHHTARVKQALSAHRCCSCPLTADSDRRPTAYSCTTRNSPLRCLHAAAAAAVELLDLGVQSAAVRLPIKVAGHQQCGGIGTNTSFAIDNYWVATCVEADVLLPAAAAHLVADIRPIQVGVLVVFTQVGTMVVTVQQLVCLQRRACNAQHQFAYGR